VVDIDRFDRSIVLFVNQFAGRSPVVDRLIYDVADSSLLQGGLFMAYLWWLWFRIDRDTAARRHDVLVAFFGALFAVLLSRIMQVALPFHPRPLHTPGLGFVAPIGVNPATLSRWNSFPSDHAMLFFALSVAIWHQSRLLGALAMAWSLVVICMPRVYLGYHYPSDVLGGAMFGIVTMIAVRRMFRRHGWLDRLVEWEIAHKTMFYCLAFLATYELAVLFYDIRRLGLDGYHIVRVIM
jgi:undecaprenyl-diphosphatase